MLFILFNLQPSNTYSLDLSAQSFAVPAFKKRKTSSPLREVIILTSERILAWVHDGICIPKSKSFRFFTLRCRQFTAGKRRGHQPTCSSVNNTPWPQCVTGEEDLLVIAGSGCSLIPIILLSGAYNSEHLHQLCPWVSNLYNYPIISDLFARDLGDFSIVDVILSSQYLCEHNSCFHCWNIQQSDVTCYLGDTISRKTIKIIC